MKAMGAQVAASPPVTRASFPDCHSARLMRSMFHRTSGVRGLMQAVLDGRKVLAHAMLLKSIRMAIKKKGSGPDESVTFGKLLTRDTHQSNRNHSDCKMSW